MKIMYVEDNDDNVYVLKRWFSIVGFELIVASDGEQGVAMAAQALPDLILMDQSLPGIDGWEAARRIKASPVTRHIPVIALTANAMSGDREKALAAGCDDFDTKPVDIERLVEKIRAHVKPAGSAAARQGLAHAQDPDRGRDAILQGAAAAKSNQGGDRLRHRSGRGGRSRLQHFCGSSPARLDTDAGDSPADPRLSDRDRARLGPGDHAHGNTL